MLAKCNTADCLEKKRMPHNAACVLCLSSPESALHLLATCNVAINIWARIINLAGLPVALQPTPDVTSLQDWTVNTMRALPQPLRKAWLAVIHLTWWNIWKERNRRIFQNQAMPLRQLIPTIINDAKLWRDAGKSKAADLLCRPREPD
jgi:hypothetical protein